MAVAKTVSSVEPRSPQKNYGGESIYSLASFLAFVSNNFVVLLMAILFFAAGFYTGAMWRENQMLRSGSGVKVAAGTADEGTPVAPEGPTEETLKKVPALAKDDYVRGNRNAKVVLIEYSDFECPFCARFHPTMTQVMEEYGDKVAWVYRHYPLPFHPHAQKAAEASECVAAQKGETGFWNYGDKLFAENEKLGGQLTDEVISSSAQAVGVNMDTFKKCLDSGEMAARVKKVMDGGVQAGITGTPGTIVLSGDKAELIPGALPFEQVKPVIDRYLQ